MHPLRLLRSGPCFGKLCQAPHCGVMEDILRAAREDDEEEVNRLLDADPTLLETEGSREGYEKWKLKPLAVAARCGHLGMVRLLVQRGANVNGMDYKGTTALSYAVYGDHAEVVAYLLHHGAKADGNQASSVPLIAASMRGHVCVVRVLLEHLGGQGLDDRRGGSGWTALHWAAFGGHDDVVRLLLLAGADPTMRDNYNNTPRTLAENRRRAACAALLQWGEGEMERRRALCRAICLHKAYTTQRDKPTSPVPTYLEARVAAGHAVPVVELVSLVPEGQQAEASGKRKAAGGKESVHESEAEGEEEARHAVLEYVVTGLNQELLTELLEGFHCEKEDNSVSLDGRRVGGRARGGATGGSH